MLASSIVNRRLPARCPERGIVGYESYRTDAGLGAVQGQARRTGHAGACGAHVQCGRNGAARALRVTPELGRIALSTSAKIRAHQDALDEFLNHERGLFAFHDRLVKLGAVDVHDAAEVLREQRRQVRIE